MDPETSEDFDMQMIGSFLSCASKGDRVGLNQMLREHTPPDVQDYDKRTALHLAASEGHASIVELLIHYNANVNLQDRWQRTTFPHEQGLNEVNIDLSELNIEQATVTHQGLFGESEMVKWRGTWVVKTVIKPKKSYDETKLSAKKLCLLRELRHPNILQFLGAIVHGEEMILITEFLSGGQLDDILKRKNRFDVVTSLRYALDIARNLLLDEGGHLKIGEYWIQMLYEQVYPFQDHCMSSYQLTACQRNDEAAITANALYDTRSDICSFAHIFYKMLEGQASSMSIDFTHFTSTDSEPKFKLSKCTTRIKDLIKSCLTSEPPPFAKVIDVLEEELISSLAKTGCPVC
ncbi:putative serine-threonine protein kinase [Cinnamomum micranthum f. kanehirae]|uniref:Putative serine-threonine protein kinase n=1 Tax=Cinnamomum micranthum f. kanehirae TaxID=337451 RepID=A0A3S3N7L3_9MAGN|nr:putative serine-threonine protein kinase [Cinnamomum micranthum f. kanehirae]